MTNCTPENHNETTTKAKVMVRIEKGDCSSWPAEALIGAMQSATRSKKDNKDLLCCINLPRLAAVMAVTRQVRESIRTQNTVLSSVDRFFA